MKEVKYRDENGYAWIVRVSDDTQPKDYKSGIRVGPPDLESLDLPETKRKLLQQRLVDAGLVNAELIKGSAGKLYAIVKNTLPTANASEVKNVVRAVKSVYQKEFYED
jgi:hypothetical protein